LKTPMEMWTEKPIKHSDLYVFRSPVQNLKNEEGDSTTRESTSIQIKKEFQSSDSFEAAPQHKMNEANESQALATRTLNHEKRRPGWHSDYVMESNVAYCLFIKEEEPSTLQKALNNPDASFWKEEIQEEIEAFHKNKTWELVPLPRGPNKDRINKLKAQLARKFEMKDLGSANKIRGMQINQDKVGYVDSDYAGDLDRSKSTTRYAFTLSGGTIG
nr:hypothetical protein [Tanacetum cinerariifolium]